MSKKSFFERLTGATVGETEEKSTSIGHKDLSISEPKQEKKSKIVRAKIKEAPDFVEKNLDKISEKIEEKKETEEEGQLIVDVYQTDNDIIIKSPVTGVKIEDLDISINNNMITIKGTRKEEKSIPKENYYCQELYWGAFSRSIILPIDVDYDKAKASIKNGILTIRLPKIEKLKTRTIKVKMAE